MKRSIILDLATFATLAIAACAALPTHQVRAQAEADQLRFRAELPRIYYELDRLEELAIGDVSDERAGAAAARYRQAALDYRRRYGPKSCLLKYCDANSLELDRVERLTLADQRAYVSLKKMTRHSLLLLQCEGSCPTVDFATAEFELVRNRLGEKTPVCVNGLVVSAVLKLNRKEYRAADALLTSACERCVDVFGDHTLEHARCARLLAEAKVELGMLSEAESLLNMCVKTQAQFYGRESAYTARTLIDLSETQLKRQDKRNAEDNANSAIAGLRAAGIHGIDLGRAHQQLGKVYLAKSDFAGAKKYFEAAEVAFNLAAAPSDVRAALYELLARVSEKLGQNDEALAFGHEAAKWRADVGPVETGNKPAALIVDGPRLHSDAVKIQDEMQRRANVVMAALFELQLEHAIAECEQAAARFEETYDASCWMASYFRAYKAEFIRASLLGSEDKKAYVDRLRRIQNAFPLMEQDACDNEVFDSLLNDLRSLEGLVGENSPTCVSALLTIGTLAGNRGELVRADSLLTRARDLCEQVFDVRQPTYAYILDVLATIRSGRRLFAEAEVLYRDALESQAGLFGRTSPQTAYILVQLCQCELLQGKLQEAELTAKSAVTAFDASRISGVLRGTLELHLGQVYLAKSDFRNADSCLDRAQKILEMSSGSRAGLSQLYELRAQVSGRLNENEKARAFSEAATRMRAGAEPREGEPLIDEAK